jgi:protein O-mannosyl-transferase
VQYCLCHDYFIRLPPPRPFRTPFNLWIYAGLAIAILVAYLPVKTYDFVNFDDPDYVSGNAHVRQGITPGGIEWALTSTESANWFPVTRLSHMLDVEMFGLDAGWHHLVNVLLHAIATLLLFAFLNRTTHARWPSAMVALLFALHPLHVESVAWIAERKDTLAALFWFLTLWAYVRYVEKPGIGRYLPVLGSFVLGLMSKPMIVTLPFVLLLIDVWPLRRRFALREKIPFFALSAASAIVTYLAQAGSGAVDALPIPLAMRVENALISYCIYIAKMFWPTGLAVFYPYQLDIPAWQAAGAALAILGISALTLRAFKTHSYLAVGWFWYLGTLVPVIGLIQVGAQARADRYTYVPMVGLSIMLAWGLADVAHRWPRSKNVVVPLAAAACVVCAILTSLQVQYWRDSASLFQHALDSTERNDIAHHNLGAFLMTIPGRQSEAVEHLEASLKIRPDSAKAHTDLGTALSSFPDRLPDAVAQYEASLRIAPGLAITHNNLGNTLSKLDKLPEAIGEYRAALRIDPAYAEAHNNLGSALARSGRSSEAMGEFQKALRLKPDYAEARQNLNAGQNPMAPAESEYNAGLVLAKEGRSQEAVAHFEAALRLQPAYPEAENNLGVVLAGVPGREPEAIRHFKAALRLRPDYVDAHVNIAVALSGIPGRLPEAIRHLREAQRIKPDPAVQQMLDRLTH